MKKYIWLLFIYSWAWGQSDSIPYQFPKIESSISVPVVIPVSEINRLVNQSVNGVIFEDNSYTDNHNDQFKTKVEKDGNIGLKALSNNRFLISVPLKIWAEQGYGGFGHYLYQATHFRVVMNFISKVYFNSNWQLSTETEAAGFQWKEKPVLDYGRIKIPIAPIIEKKLDKEQGKFTRLIDEQVKKSMDLKPYLIRAMNQFIRPIHISEEYNTWLKISPESFSASPLKVYSNQITTTLGVELYSETFVGKAPSASKFVTSLPNFKLQSNINSVFKLQTTVNIPFAAATKLAEQQFLNQELSFRNGKSKIKIEEIQLYGEDGDKIVIEARTSGDINGTSYISGTPVYDEEKKKIVLKDTHFKLKTGNLLTKALSLLFKGKITRMIEEEYGIPMEEMIASSRESLEESLNQEYYPGLLLSGKVIDFKPENFAVSERGITAIIDTQAKVQLKVSGISF